MEEENENQRFIPSKAILDAELPPASMEAFDRECERFYLKHGGSFKSFEEAQLFYMLPISNQQKTSILNRLTATFYDSTKKRDD